MSVKPDKCPKCGSNKVAYIMYGLPAIGDELDKNLNEGKIVLGGCCFSNNSPAWKCVDCSHLWGSVDETMDDEY